MHDVEWLSRIFDDLYESDQEGICIGAQWWIGLYLKLVWILSFKIYGEPYSTYERDLYRVCSDGFLYHGSTPVDMDDEVFMEFVAGSSSMFGSLLFYYEESPFWKAECECLDKEIYTDSNEKELSEKEFLLKWKDTFEDKLISTMEEETITHHPLHSFYELFEDSDDCAADDGVLLASRLLPYFYRYKDRIREEDPQTFLRVQKAETLLLNWLPGNSIRIYEDGLEYAYFLATDASSFFYEAGYGHGFIEANLAILVAGELIDAVILSLDEKMHFLPDSIKELAGKKGGKTT